MVLIKLISANQQIPTSQKLFMLAFCDLSFKLFLSGLGSFSTKNLVCVYSYFHMAFYFFTW